ncbi:hypothetical protein [Kineobactrum salinum]|uniref:hypothetical protein n=1 Tax=Kineobactrum salinum TaxID=2708301 RepID=UPI001E3CCEDB|nr:hypothetical protein [Kineobactrum salinum]
MAAKHDRRSDRSRHRKAGCRPQQPLPAAAGSCRRSEFSGNRGANPRGNIQLQRPELIARDSRARSIVADPGTA